MRRGSILGYDLNEKNCQISYYDEKKDEPETMEVSVDRYQIPLMLGYVKGRWVYGTEARHLAKRNPALVNTGSFREGAQAREGPRRNEGAGCGLASC